MWFPSCKRANCLGTTLLDFEILGFWVSTIYQSHQNSSACQISNNWLRFVEKSAIIDTFSIRRRSEILATVVMASGSPTNIRNIMLRFNHLFQSIVIVSLPCSPIRDRELPLLCIIILKWFKQTSLLRML